MFRAADVIGGEVCEHGGVKQDAVTAVLFESQGRNFYEYGFASVVCHGAQKPLDFVGFGCGVDGFFVSVTPECTDGADHTAFDRTAVKHTA